MPFGKELSHMIEEQIQQKVAEGVNGPSVGVGGRPSSEGERIAVLEANLERLADHFAQYVGKQKNKIRNLVEYGLNVIALPGLRLAIAGGRATFAGREEPVDAAWTERQLAPGGAARELRYVYLDSTGNVCITATDPTGIGPNYVPLALVDVWAGVTEIAQDRITDIRPQAGLDETKIGKQDQFELTGNVSIDTGNDSFVVSAINPAGLKVKVSGGRALVDGELISAAPETLDLTNHRQVENEFLGLGDGTTTVFSLFHKQVANVVVKVDDSPATVTVDAANGAVTLAAPPVQGAKLTAAYTFGGDYVLLFLVEKAKTKDGQSFGVVTRKIGSNRAGHLPDLSPRQHAIAKVNMSALIPAITDDIIDNSFEVKNLTQWDLQNSGKLNGASLCPGAITADKIAAHAITSNQILAGGISAACIRSGAIEADHLNVQSFINSPVITADMIVSKTITAEKFEDKIWGDLSQAMRFVKAIVGGEQSWRRELTKLDLKAGTAASAVNVDSEAFPCLRLATQTLWDVPGVTWDAAGKTWDRPVAVATEAIPAFWESGQLDYGSEAMLQAEFWMRPVTTFDTQKCLRVKVCYRKLETEPWSAYEMMARQQTAGYVFWTGTLQNFRYFKIMVEFIGGDETAIVAYPEVRAANCQIGTEDIADMTVTTAKLADGAVTPAKLAAGALTGNLAVLTGAIGHGGVIPLPLGFTQNQCKWMVGVGQWNDWGGFNRDGIDIVVCSADANRVVSAYTTNGPQFNGVANYIIIGMK